MFQSFSPRIQAFNVTNWNYVFPISITLSSILKCEKKSCIYGIWPKAFGIILFKKNVLLRNEDFILAREIPWIEGPGGL